MPDFKRLLMLCGLAISVALALAGRTGASGPPSPLVDILGERGLWGKDFPTVLACLPGWTRIKEHAVNVFPDRVVGAVPYKTPEAAQPPAGKLVLALPAVRLEPRPPFVDLLEGARRNPPSAWRAEPVFFFEDETFRVGWTSPSLQLLAPSLTLNQVEKLIGRPESMTSELIHREGDGRPVQLTFHNYAGGAVRFVEMDLGSKPGLVDRVWFDVAALSAAIFKEAK